MSPRAVDPRCTKRAGFPDTAASIGSPNWSAPVSETTQTATPRPGGAATPPMSTASASPCCWRACSCSSG
eukprot:5679366-Pyramimonas_sp.AAC.1